MDDLPQVNGDPYSLDELCGELERVHRESVAYWNAYDDGGFFHPMGEKWSPADHVRHLTKSMRPVAKALRLPRLILRIVFPRPGKSRRYAGLRADYHAVLAAGGQAGSYAPAPLAEGARTAAERGRLMGYHAEAVRDLVASARRWRDASLEGATLPHPLLGPLTLREMLMFMLCHNLHHVHVAERRRGESSPEGAHSGAPAPNG